MTLGGRIKELRKQKGWSQEELGKKIDYTRSAIGHLEADNRKCPLDKLMMLAKIFDVDVEYLITGETESSPPKTWNEISTKAEIKKYLFGTADVPDYLLMDVKQYARFKYNKYLNIDTETINDINHVLDNLDEQNEPKSTKVHFVVSTRRTDRGAIAARKNKDDE